MATETAESLKYRKIFFWILGSFFGVIFIANIFLVYYANSSWTGLSTTDAYEKGLAYNTTIAESQKSMALGWNGDINFSKISAKKGSVSLAVKDSNGNSLTGASVTAKIIRPTLAGYDASHQMLEKQSGLYSSEVIFPLEGLWDIEITVKHKTDNSVFKKRINTSN